jgi:ribosome maturation factor RimP
VLDDTRQIALSGVRTGKIEVELKRPDDAGDADDAGVSESAGADDDAATRQPHGRATGRNEEG